jgi:ribokinase
MVISGLQPLFCADRSQTMVLVVGDISVDITAPLTAHPAVGEDCLSPELTFQCGGVALNGAMVLERLGVRTRLVGCVGEDWFGEFAVEHAASEGIETTFIQRSGAAMTGLFLIAISPDGQRTFFGCRGASAHLRITDDLEACMDSVIALQVTGYAFLSESSREFVHQLLPMARERGARTVLDLGLGPSRQIPETLMDALKEFDTVFANAAEAEALSRQSSPEAALSALEQAGARAAVIKLGGQGCLIRSKGELCRVPPFAVKVVDTTGAGDAFTSAFTAGRLWGWTVEECALLANACGAAASATMGAGQRLPTIAMIREVLNSQRLDSAWVKIRAQVSKRLQVTTSANSESRGA